MDAEYFDFHESSASINLALDKFFVIPKNGKIGTLHLVILFYGK
jgi:hypothetical protein